MTRDQVVPFRNLHACVLNKVWQDRMTAMVWLLVSLVWLPQPASAAEPVLKVRVGEWPPYYFRTARGDYQGMDVDILRAIATKAGVGIAFVDEPWARGLRDLRSGQISLMSNMSRTPERSEYARWIGPVRHEVMGLIAGRRWASFPVAGFSDFVRLHQETGLRVGLQTDVYYSEVFGERLDQDEAFRTAFEFVPRAELNVLKTLNGRITGFIEDVRSYRFMVCALARKNELLLTTYRVPRTPEESEIYIGVSRHVPDDIYERLARAFSEIRDSGELAGWVRRWDLPSKDTCELIRPDSRREGHN